MECTCHARAFIETGSNNNYLTQHADYCIVNAPKNNDNNPVPAKYHITMPKQPKYPVGTKFKTRHKVPRHCKVVDILRTYNQVNELVSIRYVAIHDFLGQTVMDSYVVETTITMGLIE